MTVTAASLAAETEWMRDRFEADRLAAELGCEVTPHPRFAGIFEARDPAPGVWLLTGSQDEIRSEWRAAWLRVWLVRLGSQKSPPRLTPRERETALLVAEGLTDRQIASRLSISERTVHAHLRSAYPRTRTGSRTRLLAWLAALGAGVLNGSARATAAR